MKMTKKTNICQECQNCPACARPVELVFTSFPALLLGPGVIAATDNGANKDNGL